MAGLRACLRKLPGALPARLRRLRAQAARTPCRGALLDWGRRHLDLGPAAEKAWFERAWWGLAAGEQVRAYLYEASLRPRALALVDEPDWSAVDAARRDHGGVVLAAAHVGPPKVAMNVLMQRRLPTVIWTNKGDFPSWIEAANPGVLFLDPLVASGRSSLLARSARRLQDGALVFGAPDFATGHRTLALERLGATWTFSLGIPALVRLLGAPVFLVLALWHGNRIRIACQRIPAPETGLEEGAWYRQWIAAYWDLLEPVIRTSPENLRFLRGLEAGRGPGVSGP